MPEREGDIIKIDRKEDSMTVEKEGECPICHGDILSNQSTYPVVIRIEGEHMRPGRVHQDCALENPEEYDKIAA